MKKRRKRGKGKIFRFPRLYLTQEMILTEKILHHTYNQLMKSRSSSNSWYYDLYNTEFGKRIQANVKFLMLAQTLVEKKLDPVVYLKVLSNYGNYRNSKFIPHPTWLSGKKAMKVYKWLWKKERGMYGSDPEWRVAMKESKGENVLKGMKTPALMIKDVKKNFKLKHFEAMVFLGDEIHSWYWAVFLSLLRTKRRDFILDFLLNWNKEMYRDVINHTRFFIDNKEIWKRACNIIRKHL